MRVVIEVDLGELTESMARSMLRRLSHEATASSDVAVVRLESPWGFFPVTKIEVPDATGD